MAKDRWLVFSWHQLSKRYNIVFYYCPPGKEIRLGEGQQHVAWKVLTASEGGGIDGTVCVAYSDRYGVGNAKQAQGKVFCNNWIEMDRGEAVELRPLVDPNTKGSKNIWEKSAVKNIDASCMQAHNGTEEPEDFVLGAVRTIGTYSISLFESSFVWRGVRPHHGITIDFDPTLCAVVTTDYTESEIMTSPIAPEQIIWRENISRLPEVTYLELAETDEGLAIRKAQ